MSSLLALISGNGDPYYSINQTTTSVNEGSSVVFTITTVNVAPSTTLYWTLSTVSGIINSSDFQGGATSGSFTTNSSGVGTLSLTLANDSTTEGGEQFQLQVRTGSTSGTIVKTSDTITINDTSLNSTYSVSPSTTTIGEGSSVTFTTNTQYVDSGTTLYYTINPVSGSIDSSDFSSGSLSGSFSVSGTHSSSSGTVTLTLANDYTVEGSESFQFQVRTGSTSGTIVATSSTVTITDSSVPTYSVSPSTTSVNEGSSVTFTVSTNGIANGTTLYYTLNTISGTIDSSDFSSGSLNGSFSISGASGTYNTGGTASISYTLANDVTTEGSESFQLQVRTGSTSGTIVATSSTVTINDTSVPTYSVSPSTSSVNEGSSVTFTITTGGVANGTTLYYTLQAVSGTINSSDFSSGGTSGSFTINSNSGSVTLTLANDVTTEGSESFQFEVRTGSTSGSVVATSSTVTIIDTSSISNITYYVVSGGGGGGAGKQGIPGPGDALDSASGGGGAGGYLTGTFLATVGSPYVIAIGAGGAGAGSISASIPGSQGAPSSFGPIQGTGGGGGEVSFDAGYYPQYFRLLNGSSGGGGGGGYLGGGANSTGNTANPASEGYDGGNGSVNPGTATGTPTMLAAGGGGGGGGAGGVGGNATPTSGGYGGPGVYVPVFSSYVAGGGGGGCNVYNGSAGSGTHGGGNGGQTTPSGPTGTMNPPTGSAAAGGNAYGIGGGGGGAAAAVGNQTPGGAGAGAFAYGGNGSPGAVGLSFPPANIISVSPGLGYSQPSPTTVIFTSGYGSVTFYVA
jgi:hypothetical protein